MSKPSEKQKAFIRYKVNTDYKWTARAILALYERQTSDEQKVENTKYHNRMGFTPSDAKRLSYYAKWIKSGKELTGKHIEIARKRLHKYAGQLAKIANENYAKGNKK